MKNKVIICLVAILIIVLAYFVFLKQNYKATNNENSLRVDLETLSYELDEETGEYIVYNENGEEEVRTTNDTLIKILEADPDYDLDIVVAPVEEDKEYKVDQ